MEAYQQRVIDEKEALDIKISKLVMFVGAESLKLTIKLEDYEDLTMQLKYMVAYTKVLSRRIGRFK